MTILIQELVVQMSTLAHHNKNNILKMNSMVVMSGRSCLSVDVQYLTEIACRFGLEYYCLEHITVHVSQQSSLCEF